MSRVRNRAPYGSKKKEAPPHALPSKIRELRMKKGRLTQKALADAVGVTAASISYWEDGLVFPRLHHLQKLAVALDCTIDDLFDWR